MRRAIWSYGHCPWLSLLVSACGWCRRQGLWLRMSPICSLHLISSRTHTAVGPFIYVELVRFVGYSNRRCHLPDSGTGNYHRRLCKLLCCMPHQPSLRTHRIFCSAVPSMFMVYVKVFVEGKKFSVLPLYAEGWPVKLSWRDRPPALIKWLALL